MKTQPKQRILLRNEAGSLALEQILFIGAVVLASAGIYVFYENVNDYFSNITVAGSPQNVGANPNN